MAYTFGSILKGVGGLVGGAIAGGPIGAAIGAIKGLGDVVKGGGTVGKIISHPLAPLPAPRIITTSIGPSPVTGGTLPGGTGVPALPALPGMPTVPGSSMVTTHPDVRGAVPAQYGTTAHAGQMGHYTATGRFIRTNARGKAIRRQNPMNVHAARRAVRRIVAAEKLFRRIFTITHPGKSKGAHVGIKRKGR